MRAACLVALAVSLVATGPAHAATVSYTNGVVTVQDTPGTRSSITLSNATPATSVGLFFRTDAGFTAPTAGAGCAIVPPSLATCPIASRIEADLLDGDDELFAMGPFTVRVSAGLGRDTVGLLTSGADVIDTGDGNDTLYSTGIGATIDAGRDDDSITRIAGGQDVHG